MAGRCTAKAHWDLSCYDVREEGVAGGGRTHIHLTLFGRLS